MYYLLIKQKYITKIIWILLIPVQDWYIWVIDQVWGQDGRISAMFFFFACFMDRDGVEVHEQAGMNEAGIQSSWLKKLGQ